jgi:hypothetical protein
MAQIMTGSFSSDAAWCWHSGGPSAEFDCSPLSVRLTAGVVCRLVPLGAALGEERRVGDWMA